jgi:hypothetical protein
MTNKSTIKVSGKVHQNLGLAIIILKIHNEESGD